MGEEELQQLRSKATELMLREEWKESIQVYSQIITLCQNQIHKSKSKSLCLALSNRAEARSRLRDYTQALQDCDRALQIDTTHFKTLLCKAKILLSLNCYSSALDCFKAAACHPQANDNIDTLNGYLEKCKKLESQSRTGVFDLSDWVSNGFIGKSPELAEFIGAVKIERSESSGRGLFATKNLEAGTLVLATKAVAVERGILSGTDCDENVQLVMWKSLIDKVVEITSVCQRSNHLLALLSYGENEEQLFPPDMSVFRPGGADDYSHSQKLDMTRLLSVLDVNALVEDAASSSIVLGRNSGYYGVGLWPLASFINHSCAPNARRLHVGDYVLVHASRDVKAGEEITFAYFDVLTPLPKRKEMAKSWGFDCTCKRCKFEEKMSVKQEVRDIEVGVERGIDVGSAVYQVEEGMKRWMVRGRERGYLRASFWPAYSEAYASDRVIKRWGRRIPPMEVVVDTVLEVIGSDEKVLKTLMDGFKRSGSGGGVMEMERAMKLGRGLYGKVVKKQAMRTLLQLVGHR